MYAFLKSRQAANALQRVVYSVLVVCVVTGCDSGVSTESAAPGGTRGLSADAGEVHFETTVWPLLRSNCADCHSDLAPTKQPPFMASEDVAAAYQAAKDQINLKEPAASRLVVRLRNEFHNCWTQCGADAAEMERQISALAAALPANYSAAAAGGDEPRDQLTASGRLPERTP
jgi:hypothetical protein